jgi:DNA polymerase elongation subunit (family B)
MGEPGASLVNAFLDGDRAIVLVERVDGKRRLRRIPAEWVAYLDDRQLSEKLRRELRSSQYVRSVRAEGEHWLRVGFASSNARMLVCTGRESVAKQFGFEAYEADVQPVLRWAVDNGVQFAKPRRAYLDMEWDSRVPFSKKEDARLLCWTLEDEDGRVQAGVLDADTDADERRLLLEMWRALEPYDQVAAWNGDDADFKVLFARSERRGCKVDARLWLWLDHLPLFRRMNLNSSESGDEKQSMRLEDIAQATIGQGKEPTPPEVAARFGDRNMGALSWPLWEAGGEWRELLVRYCLKDTRLLRLIEEEAGYIALFTALCEVCHILGDTSGLNPTRQMDGFMLRLGLERGFHFPSKSFRESKPYQGAHVMDPTFKGITRGVHVADFASLYPSNIITWNMSPETKLGKGKAVEAEARAKGIPFCVAPKTGVVFRTDIAGILPFAVSDMIRLRKHYADLQASLPPGTPEWHDAKRKSMAFKVAANSFYGVAGSPYSRFFDRDLAESVSTSGVWLLELTIAAARARGWVVGYGDTDSIFVTGCTREEFAAFVAWCNAELFPAKLRELGCVKNTVKLAYEKAFDRLVMPVAKRYCSNFLHYKGKDAVAGSKPEIKGLEYKRGDAVRLARQLQARLIDMLVGGLGIADATCCDRPEAYEAALDAARDHILHDPLMLDEIKISKAVARPLGEYKQRKKTDGADAAQPAHVMLAKMMKARGEEVAEGTRIDYVVSNGDVSPLGVIPAAEYDGTNADRYYVWDALVYPPAQRLLEAAFPERDWKPWSRTRPPKVRARRGRAPLPEQAALPGLPPPPQSMALRSRPPASYELVLGDIPRERLADVKAVLERHPGPRPVVIRIRTGVGEAVLDAKLAVDGSPALHAELAPFRAPAA